MIKIILVSIFGLLALLAVAVTLSDFLKRKKLLKNGKAAEAEITRIEKYKDPNSDKITVTYKAEGVCYEGTSYKPSHNLKPGDIIRVLYRTDKPDNYVLEEELKKGRMIFDIVIGLIGFGIFLSMVIFALIAPD